MEYNAGAEREQRSSSCSQREMAQTRQETFFCSICLDRLTDPVTVSCGHGYCMKCIKTYLDEEDQEKTHKCPQCRKVFTQRPVLRKDTALAGLLEELTIIGGTAPQKKPRENICSPHNEVMQLLWQTDQCRDHNTDSAATERTERQRVKGSRLRIQQRIQDRHEEVKLLQQEVEAIGRSADQTVEDSEKLFTELIRLLEQRRCEVTQRIRSQQETEVGRVKELQEKLEQEIAELQRKEAELEQLSHTRHHIQFLHGDPSLSALSGPTHSSRTNSRPLRYFEDVTAAVSKLRERLQEVLREMWAEVPLSVTEVDALLPSSDLKAKLETRADFLHYSCQITLDPHTAHTYLLLSDGNRKATLMSKQQSSSGPSERFSYWQQVLGRQGLMGRCYWEVAWRGTGVYIAASYGSIHRQGHVNLQGFGRNDKSWALLCYMNSYSFLYNNCKSSVSGPVSSRIGVYLDHRAGVLSFYSVSGTMTLLHRVQTTFTEPLYAGVSLIYNGDTAEFCMFKPGPTTDTII
ncbi:tripartite motif-containing protein 16-like protein [Betta splendens]|uniref:Tripartite motif-containing protein 16-like protein n=1 Tax=Betta splendens TaxID=158456 RepID=A0A6P7LUT2_BETSP|nr:tripartite motif-containing protein 16-like protein [Betta splendens]